MPTLNWIAKEKIINHHNEVPFYSLKKSYTFNAEESENMIIHGDNLYVLKSLLPKYEGKIDCVYIDPPYNTGTKEGQWVYSDNVDDPRIKKWLGEVVGAEGEDLTRHDKWLCMMYPRLKLLHKLMSEEAAIFISIDDNEVFNLKLICDEIFGATNFACLISVEINPKGRKNSDFISVSNDYCLVYLKNKASTYFLENIPKDKKDLSFDENGNLVHNSGKRVLVGENEFNKKVENLASDKHYTAYYNKENNNLIVKQENSLTDADNGLLTTGYKRYISFYNDYFVENTYTKTKFIELFKEGALSFKEDKIYEKNFSTTIRMKSMLVNKEYKIYNAQKEIVDYKIDVKTTSAGSELKTMFKAKQTPFPNPKNRNFIELLISLIKNKDCTVLDCFAGSGTLGHAILSLNNKDGGNRHFIEIEMMDYAEGFTAERAKIAIKGFDKNAPLPGNFSFYEIGNRIFDDKGNINPLIDIDSLRKYVYYSETKEEPINIEENKYFLGSYNKTSYYFIYEKEQTTVLDHDFLSKLVKLDEAYIIYADVCYLSEYELKKHGIIFKKIPRDIERF